MSFIGNLIANTIRDVVRNDESYHVPDSSGYLKLDAMENPYALPLHMRAELGRRLADAALNRYPVPSYANLKHKLRARMGVPHGYDVILGNGKTLTDYVWVGTAHPDLYAKALAEGKKAPFYNHNGNYQVDLAAIPLGAEIGATALLELFKK